MAAYRFIGQPAERPEAQDKATGKALYIHDLSRPGMLYGQIKFSEHAHARIARIDTSKAERLPGVRAVVTAQNTPEIRLGFLRDNLALKRDKVRQFRDEIAAVAAVDLETARAAVALIEVEYEPLPGVFSPDEALAEGAPLVHDLLPDGTPNATNRLGLEFHHRSGDVEAGRKASRFVAEGEYTTPLIQQSCLGTAGCLAEFDGNGDLTIWAKTQIPFLAQRDFTAALKAMGLKGKRARVIVPVLGGGFGTGLDTHCYEFISILLAWKTGRPVKIVYDRQEEFACLSPRQSARTKVAQGCDSKGRLTFRQIDVVMDNGAYTSWGATYPSIMLLPATSLYRVPNVRFDAQLVYTNNTYCQAMRGYGNPEVTWPIESNLDDLAREAGLDARELRLFNCNEPGERTPMGLKITTCGLRECLETASTRIGWDEKRGQGGKVARGVGLASLVHVGGGGKIYRSDGSGIILKADDYGTVHVSYGGVEMGQGLHTVLRQAVAEALGVLPEAVVVNQTDTATCPWDVGTHASRGAFMACNAAILAAGRLRAKLFPLASEVFASEVERNFKQREQRDPKYRRPELDLSALSRPENLELEGGRLFPKDAPDDPCLSIEFGRLLRAIHFRDAGTVFSAEAFFEPKTELPDWQKGYGNMSESYAYGTQAVEVEVDRETGQVKILRVVAVHDVGRVLNPVTLRGQALGALAQGIGYALYEEVKTERGRILNPGFTDYKIPTAGEFDFPVELVFVETNDPAGPFGAKGVGEPGLVPTAPAIGNAIFDAIGVRLKDLPMTPERVLAAILEHRSSCQTEDEQWHSR